METSINYNELYNYKPRKSRGITFVLNFFVIPGAGFIYLGGNYVNKGILYIGISIVLALLTIITGGIGLFILIPWDFIIITLGFGATDSCNILIDTENKKIYELKQQEHARNQKIVEGDIINSNKIKCKEFIEEIKKYYELLRAEMFTEDEYLAKKQKLINRLMTHDLQETPEDFLFALVELKKENILNDEDLRGIKNAILK